MLKKVISFNFFNKIVTLTHIERIKKCTFIKVSNLKDVTSADFFRHIFKEPNLDLSKYIYFILFTILLSQYSCISDANFEIEGADSRIFLYSEFEPGADISLKYSTATGLNDLTPQINPTLSGEFDLTFKEGKTKLDPAFRYDATTGLFVSPFNAQELSSGNFYTIKTSLIDYPNLPEVQSTTYIPEAKPFTSLELINDYSEENIESFAINKEIQVATDVSHSYYEIEAYVLNPKIVGYVQKLQVSTLQSVKGITVLPNRKTVLVDSRLLNNQFVNLSVTGDIDKELLDSNPGVFLKLKTVNPEHYQYHITIAKEYESIYAPLSEPVINFTNIEKGIGLFSGFTSTLDTLAF